MDRRIFNIAALKEQQKRCAFCHSELYAVQDRKMFYGAKMGKQQDPVFFFKKKKSGSRYGQLELTVNDTSNDFLNVQKPVIKRERLSRSKFKTINWLSKKYIQGPENRAIVLECPNCRYYCFVYERKSIL